MKWSNDELESTVLFTASPSVCVSSSDTTLTVENVSEVMAKVGNGVRVASWLGVPDFKQQEISQRSSTERERCLALGEYWVNTAPDASWEKLTGVLYQWGEKRAVSVSKQYLQQGICELSCLLLELVV